MQRLEDRFQHPVQWVAVIHADHTEHRHVHALAIVPQRLQVQDFKLMRSAATEAALEQRRQLDLVREATRTEPRTKRSAWGWNYHGRASLTPGTVCPH